MDEYLKVLLSQVRCKTAHNMIEKEVRSHIEAQISANLEAGMEMAKAEKEAIRDMGSPVEAGISLDKIHRPVPAITMIVFMLAISIMSIGIHFMMEMNGVEVIDASVF